MASRLFPHLTERGRTQGIGRHQSTTAKPAAGESAIPRVLTRFIALFAALYAAFGVQSPYLPALLQTRGLSPEEIGLTLASATAVKLAAGPIAGRIADLTMARKAVFSISGMGASLLALGYVLGGGLEALLVVSVLQAAVLAPLAVLADTLALASAARARVFDYGWVRGAGSAAFIVGSVISGQAAAQFGLASIVWLNAALLMVAALAVHTVPTLVPTVQRPVDAQTGGVITLLHLPEFRRVVLVAALVLGSHAMHDSFAVIRWGDAGIGPEIAGLLWSEQVAAEVVVFFLLGPFLLNRIGPKRAAVLAATAGALRWGVMASTAWLPAMALVEPLHGITFALFHLACMRVLAEIVPQRLAATALALYGTVGIGAATAIVTLLSGALYGRFGASAFWLMAALALAALPPAMNLPSSTLDDSA
jgi:MFS transporter, PPP family, 3-phenylpropionic acid transporter